ncbi:hypothetical protein HJFPF1_12186 [Paramyrothecium foliicola]|nr:hypothetical protein HJFPF1_12186 [Paramyrothecium foliicola]
MSYKLIGSKLNQSIISEVGADKRFAGPQQQTPLDDRQRRLIDHVREHGYVIIDNAFGLEEIAEAKTELLRLSKLPAQQGSATNGGNGRNTFEGLKTERIYLLANKSRVFDKFALHPDILALNDYFLEPGYLLNTFQSINIKPGEKRQTAHYDDMYITVPRPHAPFGSAIMVPIDPYTADNGGTIVVPNSHTWGTDKFPTRAEAIPTIMPAGSVLYFLSTLWHSGGANNSHQDRIALTVQYCLPWVRQLENFTLGVDWEKIEQMPHRLVDLLGYKVGAPFTGHVDGHSPRAVVQQKLRALRQKGYGGKEIKSHL